MNGAAVEKTTFASLVRASQVLSVALMLRDHLKQLYKVTDACVPPTLSLRGEEVSKG